MNSQPGKTPILRPLLARYAPAYLAGLLTLLLVDYVTMIIPKLTGDVTDGLAAHSLDAAGIKAICLRIVVLGLIAMVGRFWWRHFIFGTARKIEKNLRDQLFTKLETLSQRYYNAHKTGDLMSYFTNDLEAVRMSIGPAVMTIFDSTVLTIIVLYRMMSYVSVRLTLCILIPMAAIAMFGYFFGSAIERRYGRMQKAFAELSDYVQESFSGERIVKAFVQEEAQAEAFRRVNDGKRRATLDVVKLDSAFRPILQFLVGMTYLITLVYGGWLTITGAMTLGRFVAFNTYIASLVWPMLALGDSITMVSQGIAGSKRIHEVFDETPDITDDPQPDDVEALQGRIEIDGLSFAYRDDLPDALSDISVTVEPGETLAIMGRTGAGKTTLVNLLCRVYDAGSGTIRLDGHDIRKIPLKTLHEQIAYVPQDNFLFSDTLAHNIAFGRPGATQEEIEEAARQADVHDNIMDFPHRYKTMVGERGVTLSGGQKQRSSIARALLKDSPILILDDSLSAVDTDTEERILKNLKALRAGKTTLMIAHRVSTVQGADHVLVLGGGRILEYGTPAELLEKGGVYADMVEKQKLEALLEQEE